MKLMIIGVNMCFQKGDIISGLGQYLVANNYLVCKVLRYCDFEREYI